MGRSAATCSVVGSTWFITQEAIMGLGGLPFELATLWSRVHFLNRPYPSFLNHQTNARLLTASEAYPMFRPTYIPSDKMPHVVSDLKADVRLLQTQSSAHMQTDDGNATDKGDEVAGHFPSRKSSAELNEVDSYLQCSETKLVNVFKSFPLMKKVFLIYSIGFPVSAALLVSHEGKA